MKFSPSIPSCSNENICFHAGDYSFGFNGKELDKEGMGGGASTYDYGFRIYNAALGKFLSVDPLSASYPWYTPYQFAGNKPIKCVDLDGLEEGELSINEGEVNSATLTWRKIYLVVNDNTGKVHGKDKLNQDDVNSVYNSGENIIYLDKLPGSKDEKGNLLPVKRMSKRAWKKGRAYKVYIKYEICFQESSFEETNKKVLDNPVLYGAIFNETGPGGKNLGTKTVAAGSVDEGDGQDLIYLNEEYFNDNSEDINEIQELGHTISEAISHEIGHNFGLDHEVGDYSQQGLMSNLNGVIKPTKSNNVEIINDNNEHIEVCD